jgi:hypothetical protein
MEAIIFTGMRWLRGWGRWRADLHLDHRRHLTFRRDGSRPDHGGHVGSRGAEPSCWCLDLRRPHRGGTAPHSSAGGWPWHFPRIEGDSCRNWSYRGRIIAVDGRTTAGKSAPDFRSLALGGWLLIQASSRPMMRLLHLAPKSSMSHDETFESSPT